MNGILKIRNLYLVFLATFLFTSCLTNVEQPIDEEGEDPENIDPCESITFSSNVKVIIDNNCTQCHSTSGGQFPNLDSYNGVSSNSSSVLSAIESRRMPLGGSLTNDEIATIKCWVDNGAINN
ncbi:cytochrome c [Polaribacter ponticola]|uniref:Cytochrome c n=1 Tax=Polaribacter ponticola TaxID=2978475 RepID=A0ABT5S636_9FLAO|nr:cytochrome c [Polaribacter sp. MSW5]MDD7913080.1 cytochrome c [Polaribacter sp. MSW5]